MATRKNKQEKNPDEEEYNVIRNFVENLNQNIIVIDTKKRVIIWNLQMEKHFLTKEEALFRPLKKLFPGFWEEFKSKVWGNIITKEVITKGSTQEIIRYPLHTKQDKTRYFDIEASPFKNKNQEIIGCIIIMDDVTDKINLENQLLRHARTTSLANLGASIAHEIRNPLNSISLNIQLIKEDVESQNTTSYESTLEIINNVLYEVNRLNKIITNFLKFSRPPEPQFSLENLNSVIHRVVALIKEEARQSKVQIELQLGKLPPIPIDKDQISQAIYNIVLNGIQAMKETGGKLEIQTFNIGQFILLRIKDNGPSLPVEDTSKLFDLFFTTKKDGTGLGLPTANQIIEKHYGTIVAENNLNGGACFDIYIPVQRKG